MNLCAENTVLGAVLGAFPLQYWTHCSENTCLALLEGTESVHVRTSAMFLFTVCHTDATHGFQCSALG